MLRKNYRLSLDIGDSLLILITELNNLTMIFWEGRKTGRDEMGFTTNEWTKNKHILVKLIKWW